MAKTHDILYLGDTSLAGAAGYLAGLMALWQFDFDYVASDEPVSDALIASPRKLFIVSDYPSRLMSSGLQEQIVRQIEHGAGLLMIGGWESFCGHGGDWAGTPIGNALPVTIATSDDRINCPQPALLRRAAEHPIAAKLPWDEQPPTVGGFNRFTAKAGASTVLDVQRFAARWADDALKLDPIERHPMLVVGAHGQGRTASLATDLAPHWVGGFVDWGPSRVTAQAPGSWAIEVGSQYAQFIKNLISWTGKIDRTD